MKKVAAALAAVLVLITLTGCPGRNPAPKPDRTRPGPDPTASYIGVPPVLGGVGSRVVEAAEPCPPGAQWRIVGLIDDAQGREIARPLHMLVNQSNRNGEPGYIIDENGVERPGAGYQRTGLSPLAYCAIVNPGDRVQIVVTFSIQTNAVGHKVACLTWKLEGGREAFILDHDDDTIEPGGIQTATATCEILGTAA